MLGAYRARRIVSAVAEDGLPGWLHGVARRMVSDFEDTAGIKHRGSKGTAREEVLIREFLEKYVPGHVQVVHSGEIRSADGLVSSQQDVLIVDPATPRLYSDDDYQVIPIECVHCVGEVKSHLGCSELAKAWASSAAVKHMPKTAYRRRGDGQLGDSGRFFAYGKPWRYFPTASFIFAYDSIDLEALASDMIGNAVWAARQANGGPEHYIDAVFVLKKGFIYWGQEGRLHTRPQPESTICTIRSPEPGQVLIAMTSWINDILADSWMPGGFNIDSYIGKAELGSSVSWYQPHDLADAQAAEAQTTESLAESSSGPQERSPCMPSWAPINDHEAPPAP